MGKFWIFKKCQYKKSIKKRESFKTVFKGLILNFYGFENVSERKKPSNDLKYLTTFNHTGILKVYYSLYNKYCPKPLHFSYEDVINLSQLLQILVLKRLTLNLETLENLPNQRLQNKLYQKRLNLSEPFDG